MHESVGKQANPSSTSAGWVNLPLGADDSSGPAAPPSGWYDLTTLQARSALAAEVAELERRHDTLVAELARLERESERVREKARAEGVAAAADDVARLIEDLCASQREWRDRARTRLIRATTAAVEQVLRTSITTDCSRIAEWVASVLDEVPPARTLRLRAARGTTEQLERLGIAPVVEDPLLLPGDVVVERTDGQLDLRLENVAAALAPSILNTCDEESPFPSDREGNDSAPASSSSDSRTGTPLAARRSSEVRPPVAGDMQELSRTLLVPVGTLAEPAARREQ